MADSTAVASMEVPWWSVLLHGIFGVFIGLLLLGAGDMTTAQGTLVVVQILGWYWFFVGMLNIVMIFVDKTMWGWKLFAGLIGIFAGLAIVQHPIWSTVLVPLTFVIILGIQGIIIGIIDIVRAFQGAGWGTGLLGVLSILLGGWLLSNRFVATLTAPWVAGIFAVALGIVAIVMAFKVRKSQAAMA